MIKLAFTKMHALGNDFMVIDAVRQSILWPDTTWHRLIRQWSHRQFGIGFDQCLIISRVPSSTDFFYRIFNADGTEVGQCGNGARCAARFIHEQGLSPDKKLTLVTQTTQMTVILHDDDYQRITVELNSPYFSSEIKTIQGYPCHVLDIGNPHVVIQTEQLDNIPIDELGLLLNNTLNPHILFPKGTNIEWMQWQDAGHLKCRVFERGVGETQACGSGAVAAMVCARKFYQADAQVKVELPGGCLTIQWEGDGHPIFMTGDASRVYQGVINRVVNL